MGFFNKLFGRGRSKPDSQGTHADVLRSKKETLSGTFRIIRVLGKTSTVSPAYEQAERKVVERIYAEHKSHIPNGASINTMHGATLPDATNEAGIEGFVRVLQTRLGTGLLAYQTEFLTQDGYSFMVIYMR